MNTKDYDLNVGKHILLPNLHDCQHLENLFFSELHPCQHWVPQMWVISQGEWVYICQSNKTYKVVTPVLICLSWELSGQPPTRPRHSLWCGRERLQRGKWVAADREWEIQQSRARQRALGLRGASQKAEGRKRKQFGGSHREEAQVDLGNIQDN